MERPLNQAKHNDFLAVCKGSRLCVNFHVGTFQMHIELFARVEFPSPGQQPEFSRQRPELSFEGFHSMWYIDLSK